jgi:hypothetical protein
VEDARAKLKSAEAARAPARVLTPARRAIADADLAVQEARATFGQGAYATVIEAANAETARLHGVARDLESAAGPAPRRRQ